MTVVHNLTRWIWENISAHVACSMEEEKSPKIASCGPSNFEGDELHLHFLKKPQIFMSSSSVIHIAYYDKVAVCGMTEVVIKRKKIRIFGCPLYEGHVHMSI